MMLPYLEYPNAYRHSDDSFEQCRQVAMLEQERAEILEHERLAIADELDGKCFDLHSSEKAA
jgi:hypothetical protein